MQTEEQTAYAKIQVEPLNAVNFYAWHRKAEPYLIQKGYEFHLLYDSFDLFLLSEDYIKTDREKRFMRMKKEIEESMMSKDEKEKSIEKLEDKFEDVGVKKANEEKEWRKEESKLKGLLKSLVDEHIWINAEKQPSAALIWKQLKIEAQMKETGNFMSLLNDFFAAKQQPGEGLVFFTSRVQIIEKKLLELGEVPTWKEILCFRVLSALEPEVYDNIQSKLFQLPREDIQIEKIKVMFQAEDSWLANKAAASNSSSQKKRDEEEANHAATRKKRQCVDCPKDLKSAPSHFIRCTPCQSKFLRKEEKKEKQEKREKKEKKTKKKNSSALSSSSSRSECCSC